jgi:hypothetical protein
MGRLLFAGFFALTPGMAVWLMVLGIYLAIRQVWHSGVAQRARSKDGLA